MTLQNILCATAFLAGNSSCQGNSYLSCGTCVGECEPTLALADALDVAAGGSIDFDFVALFDEGRDLDFGAGFDGGALRHVGRGITTGGWFGVGDFQDDVLRRVHGDEFVVPEEEVDLGAFEEVSHGFADDFRWEGELLEGIAIEVVIVFAVSVGVAANAATDVSGFESVTGAVGAVEDFAGEKVFQLGAVEGLTFAGLLEVAFEDVIRVAVEEDFETLFEVADVEHCHVITEFSFRVLCFHSWTRYDSCAPRLKGRYLP
jgi:hypothetical protein